MPPVAPKRAFGQNFLVDPNILGVIDRLAALSLDDVVLEVGPGLGVLTTFVADRTRLVHAVEIDRSLEEQLRAAIGTRTNIELVFGDAVKLDLGSLDPRPTKLVANLPYNVAAPLVITTLEIVPTITVWCVMVQREVADRFFAGPGTAAYGAVSVLVQLNAERTGWHAVSRQVFRPVPRVESALVAFRRIPPPGNYDHVKTVVRAAFAHRRKTLVNSAQIAGIAAKEQVAEALEGLGFSARVRAEALAPDDFIRLSAALA